jgi:hypothetical protein
MFLQVMGASCAMMMLSVFLCYRLLADAQEPQMRASMYPTTKGHMVVTMWSTDDY